MMEEASSGKIPSKFFCQLWRNMKSWNSKICRCPDQETLVPSEKKFSILLKKASSWMTSNSGAIWDGVVQEECILGGKRIYSVTAFCQNSRNHWMAWVVRCLKDHPAPISRHEQGHLPLEQVVWRYSRRILSCSNFVITRTNPRIARGSWPPPVEFSQFVEFIHSGELLSMQRAANSDCPLWLQHIDFYIYAIDPSQFKENFPPLDCK